MVEAIPSPSIPGLSFLLKNDEDLKAYSSELDSSLNRLVAGVKGFLELRSDVYTEKEEKMKRYRQSEMQRLKAEEEEYVKKCQEIEDGITKGCAKLKEIEKSHSACVKKLKSEKQTLKKMTKLKTDKQSDQDRFRLTVSLYQTAIKWYEDYLNIHIRLVDGNQFKFYFNKAPSGNTPYVKFKAFDDNSKFKILEFHSDIQDNKENCQEVYNYGEMMAFIYNVYKGLRRGKSVLLDANSTHYV